MTTSEELNELEEDNEAHYHEEANNDIHYNEEMEENDDHVVPNFPLDNEEVVMYEESNEHDNEDEIPNTHREF